MAILNSLQFMILIGSLVAAFLPFRAVNTSRYLKDWMRFLNLSLWFIIKVALGGAIFQLYYATFAHDVPPHHRKALVNTPGGHDETWHDALWILTIAHLLVFHYASSLPYGHKPDAPEAGLNYGQRVRLWSSINYFLVFGLSVTISIVGFISHIYFTAIAHVVVAVVFMVWLVMLNCGCGATTAGHLMEPGARLKRQDQ
jgi:hypothetical protein